MNKKQIVPKVSESKQGFHKSEVKVTNLTDKGIHHSFEIEACVQEPQARRLQIELGFNPNAYGFSDLKVTLAKTTWKCRSTSD